MLLFCTLTLFGIKCHDRRFPLRLLSVVAVFSYISFASDDEVWLGLWLNCMSVIADMLMLIIGLQGDATGDGVNRLMLSWSRIRSRFPGHRPRLPRSKQSHQPSRPSAFCSMTSSTSPFRKGNSSRVSAMLSKRARALTFCGNWRTERDKKRFSVSWVQHGAVSVDGYDDGLVEWVKTAPVTGLC